MLRLFLDQDLEPFVVFTTTSFYSYKPGTRTIEKSFDLRPWFFMPAFGALPRVVKGSIHDGPLTAWDDRSCLHVEFQGDLFVSPKIREIPANHLEPGWSYPKGNSGFMARRDVGDEVFVSSILGPGAEWRSPPYTIYDQRQIKTTLLQFRVLYGDRNIFISWFKSNPGDHENGSITTAVINYSAVVKKWSDISWTTVSERYNTFNTMKFVQTYVAPLYRTMNVEMFSEKVENPDQIVAYVRSTSKMLFKLGARDFPDASEEEYIFGDLAQRAAENVRFVSTNGLQFFATLPLLGKTALGLLRNYRSMKELAGGFLGYQYAIMTQIRDIDAYISGYRRAIKDGLNQGRSTARTSAYKFFPNYGTIEYHYKIVHETSDSWALNAMKALDRWSMLPNFEIVWDLIPLSFVVDWCTGLGQIVETMDARTRLQMYNVTGVTRSRKLIRDFPTYQLCGNGFTLHGDLKRVTYLRETKNTVDLPQYGLQPPSEFHNVVELTALLVANW